VLEKALPVFWKHGFANASLQAGMLSQALRCGAQPLRPRQQAFAPRFLLHFVAVHRSGFSCNSRSSAELV
jgi:hypothetical protein